MAKLNPLALARPDRRAAPDRTMLAEARERIPVPINVAPIFDPAALHSGTAGTYSMSGIFRVCNIVVVAGSKANTLGVEKTSPATIMP